MAIGEFGPLAGVTPIYQIGVNATRPSGAVGMTFVVVPMMVAGGASSLADWEDFVQELVDRLAPVGEITAAKQLCTQTNAPDLPMPFQSAPITPTEA